MSASLTEAGASKLTSPWSRRNGRSTVYIMSRMRMMPENGTESRYEAIRGIITNGPFMPSHPKHAAPDHDIHELIRHRWSPRAFDASREVPRADLLRLFEAARWAPSSLNEQPWRFVVTERTRTPEAFAALIETLTGRNPTWADKAPVLVLVALRTHYEGHEIRNEHAWYDAGQAVALLVVQATSVGLSV